VESLSDAVLQLCDDQRVGVSVVIADDHASFRRLARRLLESAGYSVVGEASDGASTLAAVAELRPDVVLLDVLLPDTSGFAIADQIAAEPEPPVVLLTSSRSAADYGAAVAGRRFLPKSDLTLERIEAALVGAQ
jgi:DNA-binding NarL/FixJ family response regulator